MTILTKCLGDADMDMPDHLVLTKRVVQTGSEAALAELARIMTDNPNLWTVGEAQQIAFRKGILAALAVLRIPVKETSSKPVDFIGHADFAEAHEAIDLHFDHLLRAENKLHADWLAHIAEARSTAIEQTRMHFRAYDRPTL